MSRQLVESIIDKDFVLAEADFRDRLNAIMEKKLYEEKKRIAAEKPFVQNTRADWAKYRKQHKLPKHKPVEPEPKPFGAGGRLSKGDIERRRKAGYMQAHPALKGLEFINAVVKHLESKKKKIKEQYDHPVYVTKAQAGAERAKELAGQIDAAKEKEPPRRYASEFDIEKQGKDLRKTFKVDTTPTTKGTKAPPEKDISTAAKRGYMTTLGRARKVYKAVKQAPGKMAQASKQTTIKAVRDPIGAIGSVGKSQLLRKVVKGALKGAESGLQNMEE